MATTTTKYDPNYVSPYISPKKKEEVGDVPELESTYVSPYTTPKENTSTVYNEETFHADAQSIADSRVLASKFIKAPKRQSETQGQHIAAETHEQPGSWFGNHILDCPPHDFLDVMAMYAQFKDSAEVFPQPYSPDQNPAGRNAPEAPPHRGMSAFSSASASASTLVCPPGAEWIRKAFHFMKPARETLGFWLWSLLPQAKAALAQHAQNRATWMKDTFTDPADLPDLINTSYAEVVLPEILKSFPHLGALQAPFDRYTSFVMTFCKTLQQPMSLFRSEYLAIAKKLCPLILDYDASTLTPVKRGTILDPLQSQLNKLANETKGLRDRLIATELYVRRVELRKFVQWSDRMHFDVEGVRASIESLNRSLKLIAGENRALWRTAEKSFPKTFSMGALILMHDMILVRLFISLDGSSEGLKRHARLAASGGAYTS